MKEYSILHAPLFAFFSRDFYRDVGLYWKGTGLFYLFLIMAIGWAPVVYQLQVSYNNFLQNEMPPILDQIPEITFENGELAIDKPEPYYIYDPENKEIPVAIIDTTGQITSLNETDAIILVTATTIETKKSEQETRIYQLDQINESFTLDADMINDWMVTINRLFWPILYPLLLLVTFLFRIFAVLIYAGLVMAFAAGFGSELTYAGAMRIAAIALTPVVVVRTVLWTTGASLPFDPLIFFLVVVAYLLFGTSACKPMTTNPHTKNTNPGLITQPPPTPTREPWQ